MNIYQMYLNTQQTSTHETTHVTLRCHFVTIYRVTSYDFGIVWQQQSETIWHDMKQRSKTG